jgi:hypothetical protein
MGEWAASLERECRGSVDDVMFTDINKNHEWGNGTSNTVRLTSGWCCPAPLIPPSTTVGSIQALTIHTNFTRGIDDDNWTTIRVPGPAASPTPTHRRL